MAIKDIFPVRQQKLNGAPDVYQYELLPNPLRIQITQIIQDALGDHSDYMKFGRAHQAYNHISATVARELGVDVLSPTNSGRDMELLQFIRTDYRVEWVLGAIELSCEIIDKASRYFDFLNRKHSDRIATDALAEINHRFRQHGVGYEYSKQIIRIDSQFLHAETVQPVLALLARKGFEGAEEEFLRAHHHHRLGQNLSLIHI